MLDWMNFFIADIQTGFGAFVAFYLAELGWAKGEIGLALSIGTVAGLVTYIPGGALVDWAPWKRGLAALGIVMIAASATLLALVPNFLPVFSAEILHGIAGAIITPAIAAISLGLVGRSAMSARTGRNQRFNAAGSALTAAAMGVLTPMPCIPMTVAPWVPGAPTVLLADMPTLDNTSTLMCMWAGVISIIMPGDMTVMVP